MHRKRLFFWLALALVHVPGSLRAEPIWVAEDYLLDRWTTADGLPVNGTTAVRVGSSGYVYLATFDGLVRFDGHRLTVFDAARDPGQRSNRLIALEETPDGRLWMRTEQNGLVRFDGNRVQAIGREQGLPSPQVLSTHLDDDDSLWLGTARGLVRLEGKDFRPWAPKVVTGEVLAIATRLDGRVWVGLRQGGLVELQGESLRKRYLPETDLPVESILALALDASNDLWIGGERGLARLHEGTIERFPSFDDQVVVTIRAAPDGSVLALSDAGTYRWQGEAWQLLDDRPAVAFLELLRVAPDGAVWTVLQDRLLRDGREVARAPCAIKDLDFDRTGALWLATICDGLWRLRERKVVAITAAHGLPEGPVYGMTEDSDGTLWATTAGGTVSEIRPHQGDDRVVAVHQIGVPGTHVGTVLADAEDRIWVGQTEICVLDGDRCEPPPGVPVPFRPAGVHALHHADDGSLWVGGLTGLWRFDGVSWQRLDELLQLSSSTLVRGIIETRRGNIWLATREDGLRRRTPVGDVRRLGLEHGLSGLAVRDLYEDDDGHLWVATEGRGLCRSVEPEYAPRPRFVCLGKAQGLHSNTLHRILPDELGRLWFNSNTGVFWIEQEALESVLEGRAARVYPRVYTERDGLPDREGNGGVQNAGVRMRDGRLAFPGMGGIAIFDPRRVRTAPLAPPRVNLETILLPGGRKMPASSALALPRGERVFSVRFTGLAPGLTDPLFFRYRLGPESGEWTEIGGDRLLSFERLPPGRYELQIAAIDAASGTVGPPATLRLHLPAYFYETTAFRLTLLLGLVVAALVAFWRHQRAQAARQRRLEATVDRRTAEARAQQRLAEDALATVESQRSEIETLATARTRFFTNVSHELRTPLTLLVGPLREQVEGTPPAPALAAAMLRSASRLERLVEQLLDLERIDAGRFPLRPIDLDLASLARDSATVFVPMAEREGIELDVRLDAEPVLVHGDPDQLGRLLGNLLSNALKFTAGGGRVRLTVRAHPEAAGLRAGRTAAGRDSGRFRQEGGDLARPEPSAHAELTVEDTGPGVPPEWRERIFDRFSQMGSLETRAREGAGLGLALCREVAELHSGRLYIEPGSEGGSRFVLRLPLALPPEAAGRPLALRRAVPADRTAADTSAATASSEAHARVAAEAAVSELLHVPTPTAVAPAAPGPRRRVLIAEDNADLLRYIETVLAGDYETQAVADGEAALLAARRAPPDAIVSDIVMPRRDGFQLARALRTDPELAGIPLIFLTARAGDADEIEGLAIGADQYLKKPFQSDVLRARVAAAIRTCERLRDLFARRAPAPGPSEESLAERARAWVESNAHEETLSVDDLARAMNMSLTSLHRKMVADTGQSPGSFIRAVRLARARRLLREGAGNVSEVAYGVGFVSLSGFSRAYREVYGEAPSASLQ